MFKLEFKDFLICENKVYLGQRIGDILTAIQDLDQNKEGMGTRQMVANADRIVAQIRKILHSNWTKKEQDWLKHLQKVGVALAKAIDEKDDLDQTLTASSSEIEELLSKMKVPVNSLASSKEDNSDSQSQLAASQGKDEEKKRKSQSADQQQTQENPQTQPVASTQQPNDNAQQNQTQIPSG